MSQVEDVCGENGYRCEECTHCARTRPCECGCGLLGGTCDDWLKESYMECAECGETVPNNMCEFVDEEMEVCMCTPCARLEVLDAYKRKLQELEII